MGIIRFFINLFSSNNRIVENMRDWDANFEKGKLKKGRRFR
tara:strand:+ start:662 stop:784 length:123 start_codon:yes stop_codon:yes gene_type:complete